MQLGLNPCTALEALARMQSMIGVDMPYRLGSGGYHPVLHPGAVEDVPWTPDPGGIVGSDCAGAICFAYKLRRSRPTFNRGPWATVADDINTNSMIEDAEHLRELFVKVREGESIQPGDLLTYPTIRMKDAAGRWLRNDDGTIRQWIGHVQMVEDAHGIHVGEHYAGATIIDCHGGNGRRPAFERRHASAMDLHAQDWPNVSDRLSPHDPRVRVLRVRSDIAIV